MNQEFFDAVQLMAAEKGIPVEFLYEKIANALVVAEKRNYNGKDVVFCDIDPEKKELNVYLRKNVVDVIDDEDTDILVEAAKKYKKTAKPGDIIEIPLDTKNFGRIDAQTAKHVIRQGIRDAERGRNMEEFKTHNTTRRSSRRRSRTSTPSTATPPSRSAAPKPSSRRASRSPAKSCMTATSSRSMSSMSRRPRKVPARSSPEPTTVWSAGSSRPRSPRSPRARSRSRRSPVRPAPVRRSPSPAPMRKSTPSAPASVPAVPVSARSSTC